MKNSGDLRYTFAVKNVLRVSALLCFLLLVPRLFAADDRIPTDVVGAGGGEGAKSTNYVLNDTLGEPIVGQGRTANYLLESGYRKPSASEYLAVNCDGIASMGILNIGSEQTTTANCVVSTDASSGYSVSWSKRSGSGGVNTGSLISQYNIALPPIDASTTGLVGYWNMDETTAGSAVKDFSGNGNNGTPTGASGTNNKPQPSATTPSNMNFADVRSLDFDGTDDYVALGDQNVFTLTNATFSTWVRFDTINSTHRMFLAKRDAGGTATEYQFGLSNANKLKLSFPSAGTTCCTDVTEDTTSFSTGTWYHVAVTFDDAANQVKWYVNGVNTETDTTALSLGTNTSTNLTIGATNQGASEFFDGLMDDVRIYSRALSANEIKTLYSEPHTWSIGSTDAAWGGRLKSSSTDVDTKWGTDSSSEKWLNVGNGTYTLVRRSSSTPLAGSTEIIQFKSALGASSNQAAGTYRGTVTITVVSY